MVDVPKGYKWMPNSNEIIGFKGKTINDPIWQNTVINALIISFILFISIYLYIKCDKIIVTMQDSIINKKFPIPIIDDTNR